MPEPMTFHDRVAIITGAGRGLGRSHALLLASLGATVVVNDLGGARGGGGSSEEPAREVVAEIEAAGGRASPDFSDVASALDAQRLVESTVEQFGRVDAVICSHGIAEYVWVWDMTPEQFDEMVRVHLYGSFNVVRSAWPHLEKSGVGRVVLTTSNAGLFGGPNVHYAAAKMGIVGMMRSLAYQGERFGIKLNVVAPGALTRMVDDLRSGDEKLMEQMRALATPEKVSPLYALLAHESCAVTGEIFASSGGLTTRVFVGQTRGYAAEDPTPEDLRDHLGEIMDEADFSTPADQLADEGFWRGHFASLLS